MTHPSAFVVLAAAARQVFRTCCNSQPHPWLSARAQDQLTVLLAVIAVWLVHLYWDHAPQRIVVPGVHVYEVDVLSALQDLAMVGEVDRG